MTISACGEPVCCCVVSSSAHAPVGEQGCEIASVGGAILIDVTGARAAPVGQECAESKTAYTVIT